MHSFISKITRGRLCRSLACVCVDRSLVAPAIFDMSDRPPSALRPCASCTEQTEVSSRACQKAHWASVGYKNACKGVARARRDTKIKVQSRALARVAHMSGGASDDAHCLTCLDGADVADPLLRGGACRGSPEWTHVLCLIRMAETAQVIEI